MLQLVWRHLSFDLARTGLTTMAIAAVVAVILVLEGFNEGFAAQPGNTVMDKGAGLNHHPGRGIQHGGCAIRSAADEPVGSGVVARRSGRSPEFRSSINRMGAAALAADIECEVDKITALPADNFIANDKQRAMQMGVETERFEADSQRYMRIAE